jgi:ABC-type nickel/cobalt efflux system permease component RcnA
MKDQGETDWETGFLKPLLRNSQETVGLYLFGLFTAFILGAFHALSPGHGKSMVAAYLVGSQGRIIDAIRLGLVVTVTHVLSVITLAVLALIISHYTLSQNFFPWLGVASGTMIFLTGYFLLARIAFAADHNHHHIHDHHLDHDDSQPRKTLGYSHSLKEIVSLGVAGGLVPCPSAVVILLFAIAVNRIVTGLLIILSFSLGLAAVLILIGILTVTASQRLKRFSPGVDWIKRLPVFSAGIIMVLGVVIGLNALIQAGILTINL